MNLDGAISTFDLFNRECDMVYRAARLSLLLLKPPRLLPCAPLLPDPDRPRWKQLDTADRLVSHPDGLTKLAIDDCKGKKGIGLAP
jgi:hypothetical protein